jgi:hypothetical protein
MAFHFLLAKDAPPSSTIALSPINQKPSEIVKPFMVEATKH